MAFYKRNLPHWQPEGAEFFVTFRLDGSLPKEVIKELKEQRDELKEKDNKSFRDEIRRKIFQKYENLLDKSETGPMWLKEERVAGIVENALHFYDRKSYDLYAYCIMSNHVHLVFKLLDKKGEEGNSDNQEKKYPVTTIMQSIKSYTALECNKVLKRTGAFWKPESYDRVIRDQDELENTIRYTLNNPVKAGLIDHWEEWPYSYCKPEFIESFKS